MKNILLSFCIGALLFAPVVGQDAFVKEWEKNYSTEKQQEIIQCMGVGDLDNDGIPEIALGLNVRPQAGLQSYAVQIVDRRGTKKQRWDSTYRINDVSISDVDNDGTAEILVSGADLYVLSNTAQNLNYPPVGTVVFAAVAEDLDMDGRKEFLVGTREIICMGEALNWTVSIGSQIKKIVVSDLDWDGIPEIVVLTGQNVHVLDREGKKLWISPGTQNLRDVAVANVDEDSTLEILYSTDNMRILIWEAREDGLEGEINLGSYSADFLFVDDLNQDGTPEIIVASSKLRLEILGLEGDSLWHYRFEPVESQDAFISMVVEDVDNDGWTDILLAHSVSAITGGLDSFLYFMKNQWKAPPPSVGAGYFAEALEFFNKGECTEAITKFTQAQTAFLEEGNQESADQCQQYIDQCQQLIKQADAEDKVSQAEQLVEQGEFDEAVTLYEEAKALYEELEDSENVQECSQRIAEIQEMKVPEPEPEEPVEEPRRRSGFLLVVLLVAVVGVGAYMVKRYRGATRPEVPPPVEPVEPEELEELERAPSEKIREEERKLKAKFVYGEINKNEYKEELRKLYEDED